MIRAGARLVAIAAALVGLLAGSAHADGPPSRWDRARDPSLAEAYRLHVVVQRRLAPKRENRFDIGAHAAEVLAARSMLERYGADESKEPFLRFDLGAVYLELKDYGKAARVLKSALADFPDHSAADKGWLRLAFACGYLGDHPCERSAYVQVLRRATDEVARETPTLNLAETEMHLGNLREAAEGYREALRLAGRLPASETAALAVWGLAVSLDRSGDRLGAEKEARFARELERSMAGPRFNILRTDGVFFMPSYEIHWYEGLGAAAQAKEATTAVERVRLARAAERSFFNYVRFAEIAKEKDRWLDLAKIRLANAKSEREKAEKKYGKEPPRVAEDDEVEFSPP